MYNKIVYGERENVIKYDKKEFKQLACYNQEYPDKEKKANEILASDKEIIVVVDCGKWLEGWGKNKK